MCVCDCELQRPAQPGTQSPGTRSSVPTWGHCPHRQLASRVRSAEFRGGKALLEHLTPRQTPTQASSPKGTGPHPRIQPGHPKNPPWSRRWVGATSAPSESTQLIRARRALSILPGACFIPPGAPQPLCGTRRGDPGVGTALHRPSPGTNPELCPAAIPRGAHRHWGVTAEQLHPGGTRPPRSSPRGSRRAAAAPRLPKERDSRAQPRTGPEAAPGP